MLLVEATDHAQQLVVRHHVHDAGVHADAAVGAGEGIDLVFLIDLEVQRNAFDIHQAFRQVAEALGVGVGLGQNLALGIELGDVLVHIGLDLFVRQGKCLRGHHAALEGAGRIEGFGAGSEHQHACCKG